MGEEYTIVAVGKTVKDWENSYGKFRSYLVQVEGNGEPVAINKKAESDPPVKGDKIFGKIETTEYGQKFKSQKKPFSGGYQRDDAAIKAQWAIGQAVQLYGLQLEGIKEAGLQDVEYLEKQAKELFAMVDRVKSGEPAKTPARDWGSVGKPKDTVAPVDPNISDAELKERLESQQFDEPINLEDIPF